MSISVVGAGCSPDEVASVGSITITREDIANRARVSGVYYPGSDMDYVGLAQLVKGYLAGEILSGRGIPITDAVLSDESARIDANSKAPEVLEKVKNIFGNDRDAYLKTFVRVVYAERILYNDIFITARDIHLDRLGRAHEVLRKGLTAPKKFAARVKESGFALQTLRVSPHSGITPAGEKMKTSVPGGGAGVNEALRIIEAIGQAAPGDMILQVLEGREGFQVLRFAGKDGDAYVVESAVIPKKNYDEWFWEQARDIPVSIADPALKASLVREVGWVKFITLQ